jgi:hypothetical protein
VTLEIVKIWLISLKCNVTVLLLRIDRARRRWLKPVPEGRKNSSTSEQKAMVIITLLLLVKVLKQDIVAIQLQIN